MSTKRIPNKFASLDTSLYASVGDSWEDPDHEALFLLQRARQGLSETLLEEES